MSDPFVAEIRIFPFNFPPTGWAFCNGQLLPINQNTALFSLLGTTYGGDGRVTYALPNMQGSVPMHPGQGPGLSLYDWGEAGGADTVTLLTSELPAHSHSFGVTDQLGEDRTASAEILSKSVGGNIYGAPANLVPLSDNALPPAGGNFPHNNLMPYLTLNFCIAMQGVFPPRG